MSNNLNQEFNFSDDHQGEPKKSLQAPVNSDDFDTIRLHHSFQKSWKSICLVLTSSIVLAFFYNRYTKPLYRASATIQLEFNDNAKLIGLTAATGGRSGRKQQAKSLSGEIEIIKSNVLYEEVLKQIDLQIAYFYEGQMLDDEKFGSELPFRIQIINNNSSSPVKERVYVTIKKNNQVLLTINRDTDSEISIETEFNSLTNINDISFIVQKTDHSNESINAPYYFVIKQNTELMNYLNKNLSVEILNYEANTLAIHFSGHNKNKATRITKEIIDVYLKKSIEQKQKSNAQTLAYINNQLDSTLTKLEDIEGQMQNLSKGSMFGNTSEAYTLLTVQIDKYTTAKNDLSETLELLNHLNKLISSNSELDNFIPQLEGLGTTTLTSSITHLNEINQDFQKLKESHKSSTLSYKNKQIERNATRNTILGYIFENKKILLEKLQEISEKLADLSSELRKLPSKETDLVGLKRYYGLYENFFLLLNKNKK